MPQAFLFTLLALSLGFAGATALQLSRSAASLRAKAPQEAGHSSGCRISSERRIVRGNSLAGVVAPGTRVTVLANYYSCNAPQRGDLVAYRHAGRSEPLIKIVKAVPGDAFRLEPSQDGSLVLVNGDILRASSGEPYRLDRRASALLALYERDYRGVIPEDSYLLLGNAPQGSLDSTRFGLISREAMVAKVLLD